MSSVRYYLLTGATSGLGLEVAAQLARADASSIVIAGARETANLTGLRRAVPAAQLQVMTLDTSSLSSVRAFATEVAGLLGSSKLSGVALNAGVQIISGDQFSVDGYEMTFAANVLGHIALFHHLQPALCPSAVVVSTSSGTHDGAQKLANDYKFFGGYFPSADDVAAGKVSGNTDKGQLGRDRYATSKLCNILFTYAAARECGEAGPRFIAYDPGLMPGTELARDQPAAIRFAWKNILPTAAKLMDGASTAKRSGALLAQMLAGQHLPNGTGLYVDFTGNQLPSSQLSYDEAVQQALMMWVRTAAFGTASLDIK